MPYKCEHGHTEFNPLCVACEAEIDKITSLKRLRAELGLGESGAVKHVASGATGVVIGEIGKSVVIKIDGEEQELLVPKSILTPIFTQTAPQTKPA